MNQYQKIAFANHCRFAFETLNPQFCHLLPGDKLSLVLSVNSGYE